MLAYPPSTYPQPSGTAVVSWRTRIGTQSYTYVALHLPGYGWYLTGQITAPLSWDALCFHFPPEDGRFLELTVTGQITTAFNS